MKAGGALAGNFGTLWWRSGDFKGTGDSARVVGGCCEPEQPVVGSGGVLLRDISRYCKAWDIIRRDFTLLAGILHYWRGFLHTGGEFYGIGRDFKDIARGFMLMGRSLTDI